jgi:hypothetical protein
MEESENIDIWNINNMVVRIIGREHNVILFEEIEISIPLSSQNFERSNMQTLIIRLDWQ